MERPGLSRASEKMREKGKEIRPCTVAWRDGARVLDVLHLLPIALGLLMVVDDKGLGDALSDGVDLGRVTAATHADPHVDAGEAVAAE